MMEHSYWDRVAEEKTFTHVLPEEWLVSMRPDMRILDYGCGYGRMLRVLADRGCRNSIGYDSSRRMIDRATRENPDLSFRHLLQLPLPEPDSSFDLILLLAVLTCMPDDASHEMLIEELSRVLRPGGRLLLSDAPLQTDERNLRRYAEALPVVGTNGVFRTEDGATLRHYEPERIFTLLAGLIIEETRWATLTTMNGHPTIVLQISAQKPQ